MVEFNKDKVSLPGYVKQRKLYSLFSEALEPKIPLLWYDILTMTVDYSEMDEPCCAVLLHRFAQVLMSCAEEKEGSKWGRSILGAIGIVKPTITIQYD